MLLLLVQTAALTLAQASAAPPAAPSKAQGKDPNEVVCEKQQELGSRLAFKKVCMTRAEWAERRLLDRQAIDRAQTMRGAKGN